VGRRLVRPDALVGRMQSGGVAVLGLEEGEAEEMGRVEDKVQQRWRPVTRLAAGLREHG
jgi:hypothetical protein